MSAHDHTRPGETLEQAEGASSPGKKVFARLSSAISLVALILFMAAIMLYTFVEFRYRDFIASQVQLGKQAVEAVNHEIRRYIENRRHLTDLYARVENREIAKLAQNPGDPQQRDLLLGKLRSYIPEAHNYTVASDTGEPLLPDEGRMVGKGCRKDILAYAQGRRTNTIFVHSNPTPAGYHFDVLTDVDAGSAFQGIFFISIDTSILSDLLRDFQLPGHQLFLTRTRKEQTLIDLSSGGPRPMLHRDKFLSDQEAASSLASIKVDGTYWTVIDIPDPELFADQYRTFALQAIVAWLIFFCICLAMLWRTSVESLHRHAAEEKLRQAHDQLQKAVEERTSELRESRDRLHHQAIHDSLTGLINRTEFDRRLEHILGDNSGKSPAVLAYLDLDQFKLVNDSCGHLAGDELLKQVVSLLREHLRDSDEFGRLGGDEFGVLFYKCPIGKAIHIMQGIITTLGNAPFQWGNKTFLLNVSIGLTEISKDATDATELLRQADLACYVAKDQGRGRLHVYSGHDSESGKRNQELGWLSDIPNMIRNDQLLLHAQSIQSISESGPPRRYYEVLLRMRGVGDQILSPGGMIAAAERYNLMPGIDRWVVENAFSYSGGYRNRRNSAPPHLSINISANSIDDRSFVEFINEQQEKHGVRPGDIIFEITETNAISNLAHAQHFITVLKGLGYRFALDDFGTGVASFEYLKQLPVDILKIDGGFIVDIANDPINQALVHAMTQAAHALGIVTVAEFVEDEQSLATVRRLGVDYAQGYHFGRPADLNEIDGPTTQQAIQETSG